MSAGRPACATASSGGEVGPRFPWRGRIDTSIARTADRQEGRAEHHVRDHQSQPARPRAPWQAPPVSPHGSPGGGRTGPGSSRSIRAHRPPPPPYGRRRWRSAPAIGPDRPAHENRHGGSSIGRRRGGPRPNPRRSARAGRPPSAVRVGRRRGGAGRAGAAARASAPKPGISTRLISASGVARLSTPRQRRRKSLPHRFDDLVQAASA